MNVHQSLLRLQRVAGEEPCRRARYEPLNSAVQIREPRPSYSGTFPYLQAGIVRASRRRGRNLIGTKKRLKLVLTFLGGLSLTFSHHLIFQTSIISTSPSPSLLQIHGIDTTQQQLDQNFDQQLIQSFTRITPYHSHASVLNTSRFHQLHHRRQPIRPFVHSSIHEIA